MRNSKVAVTIVHPGGIETNLVRNARYADREGRDRAIERSQPKLRIARETGKAAPTQTQALEASLCTATNRFSPFAGD